MSESIITPTQTKNNTQFGGSKYTGLQDQLYESYSKFTIGELEDLAESKQKAGSRIATILESDGEYVDDGDGDVCWEGLWDGMRNKLNSDLLTLTLELQIINQLIKSKSK